MAIIRDIDIREKVILTDWSFRGPFIGHLWAFTKHRKNCKKMYPDENTTIPKCPQNYPKMSTKLSQNVNKIMFPHTSNPTNE